MSPCWLIEPVTAMSCRVGNPERAESSALYFQVELALVAIDAAVGLLEANAGGK